MPYIKPNERDNLDHAVTSVIVALRGHSTPETLDGQVNYVMTKILKNLYKDSYAEYNRAIGVVECVKQEFYRIQVSSHEDEARGTNGDV